MSVTKAHTLLEASNFYLWLKVFLEAITAKQLGGKEKEKKIMAARQGLGQLPMHGVCAFTTAHLNQYMSNSAWNTISLCVPKKKKRQQQKIHRRKIKDKLSVPLESAHIRHVHSFSDIWQVVLCCSTQKRIYKYCLNVSTQLIPL